MVKVLACAIRPFVTEKISFFAGECPNGYYSDNHRCIDKVFFNIFSILINILHHYPAFWIN